MMLAESIMHHAIVFAGTVVMVWLPWALLGACLESWTMTGRYTWWLRHGSVRRLAGNPWGKMTRYLEARMMYEGTLVICDDCRQPTLRWIRCRGQSLCECCHVDDVPAPLGESICD